MPSPTPEEIEAAAEALFKTRWVTLTYSAAPEDMKEVLREAATAALSAGLKADPQ